MTSPPLNVLSNESSAENVSQLMTSYLRQWNSLKSSGYFFIPKSFRYQWNDWLGFFESSTAKIDASDKVVGMNEWDKTLLQLASAPGDGMTRHSTINFQDWFRYGDFNVSENELKRLYVLLFRSVERKDRRKSMKLYKQCFVAR